MNKEHCIECNAETGKAGACEDSLYIADHGPFCDECYDKWKTELLDVWGVITDHVAALAAKDAELSEKDAALADLRDDIINARETGNIIQAERQRLTIELSKAKRRIAELKQLHEVYRGNGCPDCEGYAALQLRIAELEKANKRLDADNCYTHQANVEFIKREADLRVELAEMKTENELLRENMGQHTTLSPSEMCRKYHWQSCNACDRANCGDNITPSILALRAELTQVQGAAAKLEAVLEETREEFATARAEAQRNAGWMETAREYANSVEYYRGLVLQCGEIIGRDAYIADDGGLHDDVLCAKVPELVQRNADAAEALAGLERLRADGRHVSLWTNGCEWIIDQHHPLTREWVEDTPLAAVRAAEEART